MYDIASFQFIQNMIEMKSSLTLGYQNAIVFTLNNEIVLNSNKRFRKFCDPMENKTYPKLSANLLVFQLHNIEIKIAITAFLKHILSAAKKNDFIVVLYRAILIYFILCLLI